MPIHFGTSGWRAVFAEEFTFANVRKLSAAIAVHVREHPEFGFESPDYRAQAGQLSQVPVIVIGYDTRFLSEAFAREAAEVFATFDIRSLVATSDAPTPAVAHAVLHHKAVGGVMITASHNPAQYNGYKWTPYWGGPATPAVTDDIERRVNLLAHSSVPAMPSERAERENWVVAQDFKPAYFKQLASLLDVPKLRGSRLKVGVDALRGAVRQYLRPFFQQVGIQAVGLHEDRDVLFGGGSSEPSPEHLGELIALVKKDRLDLGFACDGDGDRFGIVDAGGVWIPANDVLALAVDHLVRNRGLKGKIARSLMSSHFVDAVAKSHGLEVRETPVGFKFIGEFLRSGQFLFGGEESGGLSIMGHVPEKDGMLACLLMAELVAFDKKPLAKIREQRYKRVGTFFNVRRDFRLERASQVADLQDRLRVKPPLALAGSSVWRINQTDGFKFIMKDGSWLGLRASATEPVVRLYAEAAAKPKLDALLEVAEKIIKGKA